MYSGAHLIHVDDSTWNITASEDQDNDIQNPGNSKQSKMWDCPAEGRMIGIPPTPSGSFW